MCLPASFVLTKDRVFWSKRSDSHEDIIQQHRLHADGVGGPNIVRVEISPQNGDLSSTPSTWKFRVDQDELPDWVDVEDCEKRVRAELLEWYAAKVVTQGEREVRDDEVYAYGSSNVTAYDSSNVTAYGYSNVTACGSSNVTAYGYSNVTACGSSNVKAYDSSNVTAYDSSNVTACEHNSTVRHYSTTEPSKPVGPHAVVIDSRGPKSICIQSNGGL